MLIGGSSSPGAGAQVTASRLSLHRYSEWVRSTAKTRFHCRMPPPTFCGEKGDGARTSGMLVAGSPRCRPGLRRWGHPPTFPFLVRICLQWSQPSFLTVLIGMSERSEVECLLERASSDVPRLSRDYGGTGGHRWGDAISSTGAPARQSNPRPPCYRGTQAGCTPRTPSPRHHPTLTPSVKKLLSMRRLGTRLGILLGGEQPP